MLTTIIFTNEIASLIGAKYDSDMRYGVTFYSSEEEWDDWIQLVTRDGKGDELAEFYYEFSPLALAWLRAKGVAFELAPYSRNHSL